MEPGEFDQASFIDDLPGKLEYQNCLYCIYVGSYYVWSLGGACCTSVRVMVHVYYYYLWSELESGPYYFIDSRARVWNRYRGVSSMKASIRPGPHKAGRPPRDSYEISFSCGTPRDVRSWGGGTGILLWGALGPLRVAVSWLQLSKMVIVCINVQMQIVTWVSSFLGSGSLGERSNGSLGWRLNSL